MGLKGQFQEPPCTWSHQAHIKWSTAISLFVHAPQVDIRAELNTAGPTFTLSLKLPRDLVSRCDASPIIGRQQGSFQQA